MHPRTRRQRLLQGFGKLLFGQLAGRVQPPPNGKKSVHYPIERKMVTDDGDKPSALFHDELMLHRVDPSTLSPLCDDDVSA